jgi:hypothetical protein
MEENCRFLKMVYKSQKLCHERISEQERKVLHNPDCVTDLEVAFHLSITPTPPHLPFLKRWLNTTAPAELPHRTRHRTRSAKPPFYAIALIDTDLI